MVAAKGSPDFPSLISLDGNGSGYRVGYGGDGFLKPSKAALSEVNALIPKQIHNLYLEAEYTWRAEAAKER
jgi:hypothetical protein